MVASTTIDSTGRGGAPEDGRLHMLGHHEGAYLIPPDPSELTVADITADMGSKGRLIPWDSNARSRSRGRGGDATPTASRSRSGVTLKIWM